MPIHQLYTHSPLRNFTYILHGADSPEHGGPVYCIDPFDPAAIADWLSARGLRLTHIINTHEHHDHVAGNPGLLERYPEVQVLAHERAQDRVPGFTDALAAGVRLGLGPAHELEVLDTPGHSRGHICLLYHDRATAAGRTANQARPPAAVFTGDILFNAGVGRCDRGGNVEDLFQTIEDQFTSLADSVRVYPGHEYMGNNLKFTLEYEPQNAAARALLAEYDAAVAGGRYIVSDIGMERAINTFLRLNSPELRRELQRATDLSTDAPAKAVFMQLRRLRDDW